MGLFKLPFRERIEWAIVFFGYIAWQLISGDVHLLALLVLLYAYWLNQKIIKLNRKIDSLSADKQQASLNHPHTKTEETQTEQTKTEQPKE